MEQSDRLARSRASVLSQISANFEGASSGQRVLVVVQSASVRRVISLRVASMKSNVHSLQTLLRTRLAAAARPLLSVPQRGSAPADWRGLEWREYLLQRGWLAPRAFQSAPAQQQDAAVAVATSLLSYPTTLARAWHALGLGLDSARLCVMGARVEAELPPLVWEELAALTGCREITLQMIGPEAGGASMALPGWELGASDRVRIETTPSIFERSGVRSALREQPDALPDAFAFFNPGLGAAAQYSWQATIATVLDSGRPSLLTAYDVDEATRDAEWLLLQKAWRGAGMPRVQYEANPWASELPCWNVDTYAFYRHWSAQQSQSESFAPPPEAERLLARNQSWPNRLVAVMSRH